jgi:hypothetical protein
LKFSGKIAIFCLKFLDEKVSQSVTISIKRFFEFGELQKNATVAHIEKCWKMRLLLLSEASI